MLPIVVVITGPSGSGKTTVGALLERDHDWHRIITVTTRAPRPGEKDGVDYWFLSQEDFREAMCGALGEYTEYIGNGLAYGIYRRDLDEALSRPVSYVITDREGLQQMRRYYEGQAQVVGVFLLAARGALEARMRGRGDSFEQITRRLLRYEEEVATAAAYDAVVMVDHLTPCEVSELVRGALTIQSAA